MFFKKNKRVLQDISHQINLLSIDIQKLQAQSPLPKDNVSIKMNTSPYPIFCTNCGKSLSDPKKNKTGTCLACCRKLFPPTHSHKSRLLISKKVRRYKSASEDEQRTISMTRQYVRGEATLGELAKKYGISAQRVSYLIRKEMLKKQKERK